MALFIYFAYFTIAAIVGGLLTGTFFWICYRMQGGRRGLIDYLQQL